MIFSICNPEKLHTEMWNIIEEKLPKGYKYPDMDFLMTLDPTLLGKDFILGKMSLTPEYWPKGDLFWSSLPSQLPESYSVPDGTMIRRLLEVL
ncbi:hypothetical protein D3C78_1665400 [compost metagenome]